MRVANYLASILASTCMYFLDVRNLVYKRIVCVIIACMMSLTNKSPSVELTHIFTTDLPRSHYTIRVSLPQLYSCMMYTLRRIRLDTLVDSRS